MPPIPDLFAELSPAQRILLAEMLWDTVAAKEDMPVNNDIRAELDKRLAAEATGQVAYDSWAAVKERLLRL